MCVRVRERKAVKHKKIRSSKPIIGIEEDTVTLNRNTGVMLACMA